MDSDHPMPHLFHVHGAGGRHIAEHHEAGMMFGFESNIVLSSSR